MMVDVFRKGLFRRMHPLPLHVSTLHGFRKELKLAKKKNPAFVLVVGIPNVVSAFDAIS